MLRLKRERILRELTQQHIEDRTGIRKQTFCYIERGRINPTDAELKAFAAALGFKGDPSRLTDHVSPTGLPDGAESKDSKLEKRHGQ